MAGFSLAMCFSSSSFAMDVYSPATITDPGHVGRTSSRTQRQSELQKIVTPENICRSGMHKTRFYRSMFSNIVRAAELVFGRCLLMLSELKIKGHNRLMLAVLAEIKRKL